YNQKLGEFEFHPGPVFAQILLADEINRATPKTQSALLEAMEEKQVSIDGETKELPRPFMVMATQNPIDHAGTFPLPEAQLDRFLMRVRLGYLDLDSEAALLTNDRIESPFEQLRPVVTTAELLKAQEAVASVYVRPDLRHYVAKVVARTRVHPDVALGASTRGTINLFHGAQARAALMGRDFVLPDDIKALAIPILAHRLILRAGVGSRSQGAGEVIGQILSTEQVPQLLTGS
ncbi:MAG TPA: MoxR family ATPase, partial [Candidatus Dormibacteraeota bacterium]|nr:MoxR family ATPase [Candidatus Dormibacteraeota bacterium]